MHSPDKFSIFDINIDNISMTQSVESLTSIPRRASRVAYFVNANSLNQACSSSSLTRIINRADFVLPDGTGVRIAARRKQVRVTENVNGTDMLPLLCEAAIEKHKSIYLLGSTNEIVNATARRLKALFPLLDIAGTHHGYLQEADSCRVITDINRSGANILLVGMGTPKQETWLDSHRSQLTTDINIAVGGLFDYYSGKIPRAPLWMRKKGIEWIWRLMQEPYSKFYRYVIGNPAFLFRIAMTNK